MDQALKERLVGAVVLVILVVIFLPMLLSDHIKQDEDSVDLPEVESVDLEESNITEVDITEIDAVEPESKGQSLSIDNKTDNDTALIEPDIEEVSINAEENSEQIIEDKQTEEKPVEQQAPVEKEKVRPSKVETVTETKSNSSRSDVNRLKEMGLTSYVVQLGTFSNKANADSLVKKLRNNDFPAFIEPIRSSDKTFHRVRVGPEVDREDAQLLLEKLRQQMKIDGTVLEYP